MPVNAGYEYAEAQKKVSEAKTPQEKIKAWEGVLSATPTHKGTETLRSEIKQKISKLRQKLAKEAARKGGRFSISVKKEGAAQVVLTGLPNAGKSYILKKFTGAKVVVADYPFTTKMPAKGVMDHEGIKIQMVEIPAIFKGYSESDKGPSFLGIARSADLIAVVLDGNRDVEKDLALIQSEFDKAGIKLKKLRGKSADAIPCLLVLNKLMKSFTSPYPVCWVDDFSSAVWNRLALIWVQTKLPHKKADWPPVALKEGDTVNDLAVKVHKDFIKNFRFARIWGKSVKHDGTNAGLEHVLAEGDVVEFHLR